MDGDDIPVDEDLASTIESVDSYLCDASRLSMASSVSNYRIENNRAYHSYRDGSYWAPHDEASVQLDTILHHMFLLTLKDQLFLSPLHNPTRALDVGTGNGIWAQGFADRFPDADVIGTDLSPIQDRHAQPNLRFEIDDCCSPWVYPSEHFDYIHVRLLYGSVSDWATFYREAYHHLKPGGWFEQTESSPTLSSDDDSIPEGSPFSDAKRLIKECSELSGKALNIQPHLKHWIEDAGFVDVHEKRIKWPLGDWPADPKLKDIGKWNAVLWTKGFEGWVLRLLTKHRGWTPEQVRVWTDDIRNWIKARRSHAYQDVSVVYGRKPLD